MLLAVVTVPFCGAGTRPNVDTLGEIDGKQVVGTQTHFRRQVKFNMTTPSDGLTLGEALALWLFGSRKLMPRDFVHLPGESREEMK